ncbi:unnamed protein product (macronuclear) [Paramecium tetraurelia]|uniref:Uncharacterized protein n=1 Tax=Paramecium tetraurelia TaxID=5888 RepID=A0DXP4_PARTE|nr:uncharacterized protein GSPATT00021435001 [Paramecium tetraurelia]CAK87811.1 unnamed protein product [Paramecium tetraurelia]|eukprot:XP_001455208.1 hypothetical protein (macronuclear) [Paramecium tetraurelia strain d4-2]
MSESPHSLKAKIQFLHQENQQLRNFIEDLQTVIKLNKQSMRSMIDQDDTIPIPNQKAGVRENENTVKALKLVLEEQQKEIGHLMSSLEKVQKERDFAQGKALISEEITYAAEKSEKKLIAELESTIYELKHTISQQAQKLGQFEKKADQVDDTTGVMIRYRDVINPNSATILLHEEMETLHQLIVRLQLQVNYLKSIQLKLVTLINKVITNLQMKNQVIDQDEDYEKAQHEFLEILTQIQCKQNIRSRLPTVDLPARINSIQSPMNTDMMHSPVLSPFPVKAPQVQKKNYQNLNQTFDVAINDSYQQCAKQEDPKKNISRVPKLNLAKAFQIQQINAKRSTQQIKLTEDQLQHRVRKLEQELEETKKNLQREMILCKHYEIENESLKRYIKQVEANNDILVKSNLNLNQKWEKIQKSFMYYKTFFVEHKDQFAQLQILVQSEKEKAISQEDYNEFGFNSARVSHARVDQAQRKKTLLDQTITSYVPLYQESLMDIETHLGRVNQSLTYNQNNIINSSYANENDGELATVYLDKNEISMENPDWRNNLKKEWTKLATQIHSAQPKNLIQQIKQSLPIQKLQNIKS